MIPAGLLTAWLTRILLATTRRSGKIGRVTGCEGRCRTTEADGRHDGHSYRRGRQNCLDELASINRNILKSVAAHSVSPLPARRGHPHSMSEQTLASIWQLYRLNAPIFDGYANLRPDWTDSSGRSTANSSRPYCAFVLVDNRQPTGISHGATGRVFPVSR